MVKPFRRLYEALRRPSGFFLTSTQEKLGVYPEISFKTMTRVYLADLAARASIDFLADQVVGAGFHTTMNSDYTERSENNKSAKEIVDDFCEEANLDVVLQDTAKYLVGWGNAFWWVGDPEKIEFLKVVPIEIVQRIHLSEGEVSKLALEWHREPKEIDGDELIHLAYNRLTAEPLGVGILYSLCAPLDVGNGETREPFYQIKGKIHKGMTEVIYKWGAPNELWVLPGLSKAKLDEAHRTIKSLPMKGARFTTTVKDARVQPIVAERMRGLDFYVETLEDEFVLGLETPLAKLVTKTGFTEASANAALEIAERRVMALQRFIKRSVERHLFDRVVSQAGLDPQRAQVRLNWGMPVRPEFNLADVLQAFELSAIDRNEARKILIQLGWPLEIQEQPETG
ncbi:MAG: hypothetical protein ACE5KC_02005 [Candidatus Bathyarchaeia archaeon]